MLNCAYKHMTKLTFSLFLALSCLVARAQQDIIPNAPGVNVHPSNQIPEKRRNYTESSSPFLQDTAQSKFSNTPVIPKPGDDPKNTSSTSGTETKPGTQQPKPKKK